MSLVALWRMNESEGAAALLDHVGGFDALISGTVTTGQLGLIVGPGKSADFGGGYGALGPPAGLTGLTTMSIVAWVNSRSHPLALNTIIGHWDGSTTRWRLTTDADGKIQFRIFSTPSGNAQSITTAGIPVGETSMIGVSYDDAGSRTAAIYINGEVAALSTAAANRNTVLDGSTTPLAIGARPGGSFPFDGKIDELGVYDHALSASDFLSLYHAGTQKRVAVRRSA